MITLINEGPYKKSVSGVIKTSMFFAVEGETVGGAATCREGFAGIFHKDMKRVGYVHTLSNTAPGYVGSINQEHMLKFWREVEDRLGLAKAEIHDTQYTDCIVIEVDPFWRRTLVSRGFFTMLFRCACVYAEGGSFEDSLKAYSYTQSCIVAVNHFLSGHTTPTFEEKDLGGGVVSKFQNQPISAVEKMLVQVHPVAK